MFIKDGKRFEITNQHTIDGVTYPAQWFQTQEGREQFGITEIPDPVRGDDELFYNQETDDAPYLVVTPKPDEMVAAQNKAKALAELNALEVANLMPRVTREFMIAATIIQAKALGITEAQLLDANDPAYSPGFKKMWDFNEQTKVLRAKL